MNTIILVLVGLLIVLALGGVLSTLVLGWTWRKYFRWLIEWFIF